MTWIPDEFEIATYYGPSHVAGYTYRGLGLHLLSNPSPKGRKPARWGLSHLGSGHSVCFLNGDVSTVFPVATQIAEAGDWDFLSLTGWKDRFPDVREKLFEIIGANPKICEERINGPSNSRHDIAMQIAANRP